MLTDILAELSEEEWRDHEAALDNAWHLDLFEQADRPSKSSWDSNILAFRRGSQKGERGIHGVSSRTATSYPPLRSPLRSDDKIPLSIKDCNSGTIKIFKSPIRPVEAVTVVTLHQRRRAKEQRRIICPLATPSIPAWCHDPVQRSGPSTQNQRRSPSHFLAPVSGSHLGTDWRSERRSGDQGGRPAGHL